MFSRLTSISLLDVWFVLTGCLLDKLCDLMLNSFVFIRVETMKETELWLNYRVLEIRTWHIHKAPQARYKERWLMFAIDSTPNHMTRITDQNTLPPQFVGAVQRALIKVRYCFDTTTHSQGHRSKHANTTAPWAWYKGRWLRLAIISTPEHMARVKGQNTLPPQLLGRSTMGDD